MQEKWIQAWGQAHSALSFFYYPSTKKTYKMILRSPISGKRIMLELSNEYAKNDIYIGEITVAKCFSDGSVSGHIRRITFKGKTSFRIKEGEIISTDEAVIDVNHGEYICISIYVEKGALRSGNLIDNVELITARGNRTNNKTLKNQRRIRDYVRESSSKVLGMYFHKPIPLFQSVKLLNCDGASSITVFGDSISQQGYWTNAFAQRIYDLYPGRYSVINKSIMGNRIRHDFHRRFICKGLFGISALNRLERDVLNYDGCEYVIFALGTNDFLQYGTIAAPKSQKPTSKQVFDAVADITDKLKENNKKTVVFNIMNFGECADSRPEKEAMVTEYNKLLEDNKELFYGVYDQASLTVNPDKSGCSKLEYLGADKLHPNMAGGILVAENIDLGLFNPDI